MGIHWSDYVVECAVTMISTHKAGCSTLFLDAQGLPFHLWSMTFILPPMAAGNVGRGDTQEQDFTGLFGVSVGKRVAKVMSHRKKTLNQ